MDDESAGTQNPEDFCLRIHPSSNNTIEEMQTVSARMEPFPGNERTLASFLEGLGFRVFRVDGTFMVEAPREVWRRVFDEIDPLSREVLVPAELGDLVTRIVLLRSRPEAQSG